MWLKHHIRKGRKPLLIHSFEPGGGASLKGHAESGSGRNHHEQKKQSDYIVAVHLVILGYKSHVSEL